MLWLRLLAPAAVAAALLAPQPAPAQSFTEQQKGEIQKIIREYLLANPDVLEEVSAELTKRQAVAEAAKQASAVKKHSDALFNSPRGVFLGNRDGDVNFVEFFDYNCGFCKRAMIDMLDLMKADPKLRVVLKEFPVLARVNRVGFRESLGGVRLALWDEQQRRLVSFAEAKTF